MKYRFSFDDDKFDDLNKKIINQNQQIFNLLNAYDHIIFDGSYLSMCDISLFIKTIANNLNFKSTIYVFDSSIKIWQKLSRNNILLNNLQSLEKIREKSNGELYKIRNSIYDINLYNLNKLNGKGAVISCDKFEMQFLSKRFKNIDFFYYSDGIYMKQCIHDSENTLKKSRNKSAIPKVKFFDTFKTSRNKIRILKKIDSGKEGTVFKLFGGECAKFYFNDTNNVIENIIFDKLKLMKELKMPNNIIFPNNIIYDNSNNMIGYTMNYITGETLLDISKDTFMTINTKKKIIMDMIQNIIYLHVRGFMIGDYNLQNFIFKNGKVYFIDTDNYYYKGYYYFAIADFMFSKKYNYVLCYEDALMCEFESIVLMIHYFFYQDEAYIHPTDLFSQPYLKINSSLNYLYEKRYDEKLINFIKYLLRHSDCYSLLGMYQALDKI